MTRSRTLLPVEGDVAADPAEPNASQGEGEATSPEFYEEEVAAEEDWSEDEPARRARGTWIVPALAVLAVLTWTAFFGWVHRLEIFGAATPSQWVDWISSWSMPVLLVIGLWLLAMRNSRREANRFTDAARALAHESALLETRLAVVNRELSLARDFIASQSRDLESLGRVAAERLSTNADRLQALIRDNGEQVETIGRVSDSALSNMQSLREQLPVLSNAARDMTSQIGNAGNVAQRQVEDLVEGFGRLNQLGEAGEQHVERVGGKVNATIEVFDRQVAALGEVAEERFTLLREQTEVMQAELARGEDEALDAIRARAGVLAAELEERNAALRESEEGAAAALRDRLATLRIEGDRLLARMGEGRDVAAEQWSAAIVALEERMKQALAHVAQVDESAMAHARTRLRELVEEAGQIDARIARSTLAFDEELARRHEEAGAREDEALLLHQERLAAFDQQVTERQEEHLAHISGLAERGEALASRLSDLDRELQRLGAQSDETRENLGDAADVLADRLSQSRAVLEESGGFIGRLTEDSVRLLEIIRSSADHSSGALSESIGHAEQRLASFEGAASNLASIVANAEERGEALSVHLDQARDKGTGSLDQLQAMEDKLAAVAAETERVAQRTAEELREGIDQLVRTSADVLQNLREGQAEAVGELAERLATDSREALTDAMRDSANSALAELEEASARAREAGRDSARMLRDQLAKVNELASNLEQRIAAARERSEERVDTDFARRMALITEALNSTAIDISKAFDTDVADTQWANYLRGDRGIFTRRAVRLLDRHEARTVAAVYEEDGEFRETVNRYIHDFEAMLRNILSTRDGNTMAVTLLSSDMGKLYVALAQAIERLRS